MRVVMGGNPPQLLRNVPCGGGSERLDSMKIRRFETYCRQNGCNKVDAMLVKIVESYAPSIGSPFKAIEKSMDRSEEMRGCVGMNR